MSLGHADMTTPARTVVFAPLPELGHTFPMIRVAQTLKARGYRIVFLSSLRFKKMLDTFGFETFGFVSEVGGNDIEASVSGWTYWYTFDKFVNTSRPHAIAQIIVNIVTGCRASLLVLDSQYIENFQVDLAPLQRLLPCISVSALLPNWDEVQHRDICPKIFLCPVEFEDSIAVMKQPRIHYAEASICLDRSAIRRRSLTNGRKRVLAAFGSQSAMHEASEARLAALFGLAKKMPGVDFTMALGNADDITHALSYHRPSNLTIVEHVNQIAFLQESDAFISHGGLGSIKEAILLKVPLIVLPSVFDQPYNAMRVENNHIGLALYQDELSAESLSHSVENILVDDSFRAEIATFSDLFARYEDKHICAMIIEEALAQ